MSAVDPPTPIQVLDLTDDDWLNHPPECPPSKYLHTDMERWVLEEIAHRFAGRPMDGSVKRMAQNFLDRIRYILDKSDHNQYPHFKYHAYASVGHIPGQHGELAVQFPRRSHDCTSCRFLGYADFINEDEEVFEFDLYSCDRMMPTVLARYGDEPNEYTSSASETDEHPAIHIAKLRDAEIRSYRS